MTSTFEEEINHTIFELIKSNDTDNNIIDWFNRYGIICDEIIISICSTKGAQYLNSKQKEVWSIVSKDMRMRLYEIIRLSSNINDIKIENIQISVIIQNLKIMKIGID